MKSRKYKGKIHPFCFPCCCLSVSISWSARKNQQKKARITGAVRPVKSGVFCLKTVACTQNVQAIVLYAADIGRRG